MYHFRYREPGVMHDNAWMRGVTGSYTYRGWLPPAPGGSDRWMLRLETRYAYGRPDYHGELSDGTPYKSWGSKDSVFELRGTEGYDFAFPFGTRVTPYFGIAYRFLQDSPPSGDVHSYTRESNYYYSPLGIETMNRLGTWTVGLRLEYDQFWSGRQYSYLGNIYGVTVKNRQDKGYGVRASLRLRKENRRVDFVFEPFVRYWHIKDSKIDVTDAGSFIEPDNRTLEAGAAFVISF